MRPACPPLVYGCRFLNFSQSKSELDLAARRAVRALEAMRTPASMSTPTRRRIAITRWFEWIRAPWLSTLQYQRLDDMVAAIGLPRDKLCTYC